MKTLAGWIVGVFVLGLAVGGVVSRTSAVATPEASVVENLPAVDCGPGREALFAPTSIDGHTSMSVKCVATANETRARTVVAPQHVVYASAPTKPASEAPSTPISGRNGTVSDSERDERGRDWKDSALVIGGAAGAGAGIGAIAKGGKGAAVGAAIGGVAGTVYELARKKN